MQVYRLKILSNLKVQKIETFDEMAGANSDNAHREL